MTHSQQQNNADEHKQFTDYSIVELQELVETLDEALEKEPTLEEILESMPTVIQLSSYNYEGETKWCAECNKFPDEPFFGKTPREALLSLREKLNK